MSARQKPYFPVFVFASVFSNIVVFNWFLKVQMMFVYETFFDHIRTEVQAVTSLMDNADLNHPLRKGRRDGQKGTYWTCL